jgi:hypothetical protein
MYGDDPSHTDVKELGRKKRIEYSEYSGNL